MKPKETIVYEGKEVKSFPVLTDGETVWLSIEQMSRLFGRDTSVIGKHVRLALIRLKCDWRIWMLVLMRWKMV